MSLPAVAVRVCDDLVLYPGCGGNGNRILNESISIFLTIPGNVIPMQVLESDSIASVKLRIQKCKGFVVRNQKLVYEGRELARNNSLVRDYGVTDGNVLHLVLRLSDLQFITVKTVCGKEYEFQVGRSRTFGYVKEQIASKEDVRVDVDDQELVFDGEKLDDQWLIDDICKHKDAVIHLIVRKSAKVRTKPMGKGYEVSIVSDNEEDVAKGGVKKHLEKNYDYDELRALDTKPPGRDFWLEPLIINPKVEISNVLKDLIDSTLAGMENGNHPIRSSEGSGGVYFMQDALRRKYISVFKPIDEEPMAVNNPRGLPLSLDGEGLKRGTRVGEGALREVAAYILDHPKSGRRSLFGEGMGFAGVPPTIMAKCLDREFNHPDGFDDSAKNVKIGSLQMFMKNHGSCEDLGPSVFPVDSVHRISVLDMRLANADRHAGNILMCKDEEKGDTILIPIDHGYCLPANFEDCTFDWLYWPQARQPYDSDTVEYIRSLDAEEDIALLKFHGWDLPLECARTLRISTMLLKKGVERGFTAFTIGNIMCRVTLKKESVIEEIVREAQDSVLPGTSEALFMESISEIMDRCLDEMTK